MIFRCNCGTLNVFSWSIKRQQERTHKKNCDISNLNFSQLKNGQNWKLDRNVLVQTQAN